MRSCAVSLFKLLFSSTLLTEKLLNQRLSNQ
jgi:hypothetical protein